MSRATRPYNRTTHRLREIERIASYRYKGVVPDTDDADIILDQVACCMLHRMWKRSGKKPTFDKLLDTLNLWCEGRAPDVSMLLRRQAVRDVLQHPRIDAADE